jgi:orotate phosphoribosyltransferase
MTVQIAGTAASGAWIEAIVVIAATGVIVVTALVVLARRAGATWAVAAALGWDIPVAAAGIRAG